MTTQLPSSPDSPTHADDKSVESLPTPPMRQPSQSYECFVKGCPLAHQSERIVCFLSHCHNEVHWHCYERLVLRGKQKSTTTLEHFLPGNCNVAVCSRPHHKLALAQTKKKAPTENLGWNDDGMLGPLDTNNSEALLVEWLTTGSNYNTYRGDSNNGKKKTYICDKIADMINAKGVRKHRTGIMIGKKIARLEKAYRVTLDWTNRTGVGVRLEDPPNFEDKVKAKFALFYELDPIMRDRANATQIVNSDSFNSNVFPTSNDGGMPGIDSSLSGPEDEDEEYEAEIDTTQKGTMDDNSGGQSGNQPAQDTSQTPRLDTQPLNLPIMPRMVAAATPTNKAVTPPATRDVVTPDAKRKSVSSSISMGSNSRNKKKGTTNEQPLQAILPISEWEMKVHSLETDKWQKQKEKIDLETEKIALDYNFDLLKKYRELKDMDYDDNTIKSLIPAMSTIIDQVGK